MEKSISSRIVKVREKRYYVKVLDQLKLLGLSALVEDLFVEQAPVNYVVLSLRIIAFLQKNKKVFRNFTQDTFEKILLLSIDEVLKQNKVDVKEEELELILQLLQNSFLIQQVSVFVKDLLIKIYYCIKKKCDSCKNTESVVNGVIKIEVPDSRIDRV